MPDLPTFTISDAQAARVLAAFGTVQAYKDWLASSIREKVYQHERQEILEQMDAQLQAKLDEIRETLGM